jgi:hypothetical protein
MAIPLLALAGFQAATQIGSSIMQAQAIKSQSKFEASQLKMNAKLQRFQASEAIRMGENEAQRHAMSVKKLMGRQRAVAAASGIEVSDGSAMDIQQETAGMGALDILTIRNNAWKQAWGYRVSATDLENQARFTKIAGKYAARSTLLTGGMNAATSIMGGMNTAGGGTSGWSSTGKTSSFSNTAPMRKPSFN